ncbi:MAG: tetratricopeptide repeat protein [Planctomycetota bacterium]
MSARRAVSLSVAALCAGAAALVVALQSLVGPSVPELSPPPADPAVARALDAARATVRNQPRVAAAWGDLGLFIAAHGDAPHALDCFRRAAALDEAAWHWPYYAAATLGPTDPAAAVAEVAAAIARDPAASWPRLARGEWLASLGRLPEARSDFEALLSREPDHARARLALARVTLANGDLDQAEALAEAVRGDPRVRRAATEVVALVAARRGAADAARRFAAEAAALPADSPWPADPYATHLAVRRVGRESRIRRVAQLEAAGEIRAADLLTRSLEQEHPEVYEFIEGRMQLAAGNAAAAEQAFRRALAIDRESVDVRLQLALALDTQGKAADAAAVLRDGLALEPGHGPSWLALGRCLRATDLPAARAALRMAVATMPGSAEARGELDTLEAAGP